MVYRLKHALFAKQNHFHFTNAMMMTVFVFKLCHKKSAYIPLL